MFDAVDIRNARWAVSVRLDDEEPVELGVSEEALQTASVGKLLLLIAIARRIDSGDLDPSEELVREPQDAVADSGIWQHLAQERLRIDDLACLVGGVSDNLATNVLLRRVGLDEVDRTRAALGLELTRLLDQVRDERTGSDPVAVSVGSATELRGLVEYLRDDEGAAAAQVIDWLRIGCDLSMVAAAFGFDPLAHVSVDRGFQVVNKTGTNRGVRADVGLLEGPGGGASYSAIFNWDDDVDPRDEVLGAMRELGAASKRGGFGVALER